MREINVMPSECRGKIRLDSFYYNSEFCEAPFVKVMIPDSLWGKRQAVCQWLEENRYRWDPEDEEAMNAPPG